MTKTSIRSRSLVGSQVRNRALAPVRGLIGLIALGLVLASVSVQAEAGRGEPLIDLNRATAEELAGLPGIGASKAAAIVEYRKSSGAFTSVDELEAVRGIGPALVAKLRPHVKLGSSGGAKSRSNAAK
jgi:comEA protein